MSTYSIITVPQEKLDPYRALIFQRWLKTLRYGNDMFRLTDQKSYYRAYHAYIDRILAKEDTRIRLAVLSEDHDVVLGFSVSRGNVLDYVHVLQDQRKIGIGKHLVPKEIDTITHLTRTGLEIWANKYPKWKFDPFI